MPAPGSWSVRQRVIFRFVTVYLSVYALLNGNTATLPLAAFALFGRVPEWYTRATGAAVRSVAFVLGIRQDVMASDNGDSLGDHLLLVFFVLLASAGAAIWSLVDRNKIHYRRELELLREGARWFLFMTVFTYAVFKVFPAQFAVPPPSRLIESFGSSSRMGLLWTFMGASPGYQQFAGWSEIVGCALLMWRRSAGLGALVLLAVLTNIFAMDLFYCVPAKLCVLHLVVIAAMLLWDALRHSPSGFLLSEKASGGAGRFLSSHRMQIARVVFVGIVVIVEGTLAGRYYFTQRDGSPKPTFYGSYRIVELRRDDQIAPPLLSDSAYWQFLTIDRSRASAFAVDGSRETFACATTDDGKLALTSSDSLLTLRSSVRQGCVDAEGTRRDRRFFVRGCRVEREREYLVEEPVRWFNDGPDTLR